MAIKAADVICDNLKKRLDELEQERKRKEEEFLWIREHCRHEWGPVVWTWSCGGYRECIHCGEREDYYERD